MPFIEVLEQLVLAVLQPGSQGPVKGPDFPFTYVRGHPSFQTGTVSAGGPYRIVVAKDRIHYTGVRRDTVIFQLPNELVKSVRRQGDDLLTIRVGDDDEWIDIDFRATGLTKRRDMKRLIEAVSRRITDPRD
jgi:hypothetical protein